MLNKLEGYRQQYEEKIFYQRSSMTNISNAKLKNKIGKTINNFSKIPVNIE